MRTFDEEARLFHSESKVVSSFSGDFEFCTLLFFVKMNHVLIKVLNEEQVAHFNLFPSELAETVRQQSGVDAYRVSLTQGHWDHSNWGSPVLVDASHGTCSCVIWHKYAVCGSFVRYRCMLSTFTCTYWWK